MTKTETVLVLGGGFGGVKAALELSENPHFKVTLLSDSDELRYYPTLYHTATGGKRANSSIPLARIFAGRHINIVKASAQTVDRKMKVVTDSDGKTYEYDTLIIALGVTTNYFGIAGLNEYSYSIKSQDEVARFKKHLHDQLTSDHKPDLNYVIVGAGPTGIELAGALPAYLKYLMKHHGISPRKIHIDLIEAAPRLLPRMPKETSRLVKRRLKRLGIKLHVGSTVQGLTADELTVNGKPIRSHTVVWTAGVTNHHFFKDNGFVLMPRGKVAVDIYLQTEDDVFVIGDNANTPFSGQAQTALYDGEFVAKNLIRRAEGKDFKSYVAKKPITVIPAGPRWAVVVWGKARFHGKIGWLLREAADYVGFNDLEHWVQASRQFMTEFETEENCEVCAVAQAASA